MIIIYTLKYNQSINNPSKKKPCQIKVMNNLLILENETIGQMWVEGERRNWTREMESQPIGVTVCPLHPPVLCITYIVRCFLRRITTFICNFHWNIYFITISSKKMTFNIFEIRYFEIKKLPWAKVSVSINLLNEIC
jgi:hypothetical protein